MYIDVSIVIKQPFNKNCRIVWIFFTGSTSAIHCSARLCFFLSFVIIATNIKAAAVKRSKLLMLCSIANEVGKL